MDSWFESVYCMPLKHSSHKNRFPRRAKMVPARKLSIFFWTRRLTYMMLHARWKVLKVEQKNWVRQTQSKMQKTKERNEINFVGTSDQSSLEIFFWDLEAFELCHVEIMSCSGPKITLSHYSTKWSWSWKRRLPQESLEYVEYSGIHLAYLESLLQQGFFAQVSDSRNWCPRRHRCWMSGSDGI